MKSKFGTYCVITITLLFGAGCSKKTDRDEFITIGAIFPITGEYSHEGIHATNGLQIAKNEINEKGGIYGKMVDLIVLNEHGDEGKALRQYQALKEKGACVIICSDQCVETILTLAQRDAMPVSIVRILPDDKKGDIKLQLAPDESHCDLTPLISGYNMHFSQTPPPVAIKAYECMQIVLEEVKNAESANENNMNSIKAPIHNGNQGI